MANFSPFRLLTHGLLLFAPLVACGPVASAPHDKRADGDASVLILGGGVAGIIAARTLYEQGITDFTIVEARGGFL